MRDYNWFKEREGKEVLRIPKEGRRSEGRNFLVQDENSIKYLLTLVDSFDFEDVEKKSDPFEDTTPITRKNVQTAPGDSTCVACEG